MLTYTITGDTVFVSDHDRDLIEKRFKSFERFTERAINHELFVTATKTTAHQREDSIRVEVSLRINSEDFFATGHAGDLMSAVDAAKEELMRVITQTKAKRQTLFHRGARKLKGLIKRGKKTSM